jgi:hypothetical protein
LTSLLAPATLSVTRSLITSSADVEVFNIGISNSTLYPEFVYPQNVDLQAAGASPQLGRIVGEVAFTGRQQDLQPPVPQPNISYELQAFAPLVCCNSANSIAVSQIITMLMTLNGSSPPFPYPFPSDSFDNQTFNWSVNTSEGPAYGGVAYFAIVPVLQYFPDNPADELAWWTGAQGISMLSHLEGQILVAILALTGGAINEMKMEFISCQLYNSSLTVQVDFTNNVSSTTVVENKWMNDLYETDGTAISDAYFAFFQQISENVVGSVSWWVDSSGAPHYYPSLLLMNTNLGLSSQIYNMNQRIMKEINKGNQTYSEDSVRNISFAQNIEDFALNSSLSLLSDATLWYVSTPIRSHSAFRKCYDTDRMYSNTVMANVTTTSTETVYLYEPLNLILVYSFVLGSSTIAVLCGMFAFYSNGVSHDASVSTFAVTMQDPEACCSLFDLNPPANVYRSRTS